MSCFRSRIGIRVDLGFLVSINIIERRYLKLSLPLFQISDITLTCIWATQPNPKILVAIPLKNNLFIIFFPSSSCSRAHRHLFTIVFVQPTSSPLHRPSQSRPSITSSSMPRSRHRLPLVVVVVSSPPSSHQYRPEISSAITPPCHRLHLIDIPSRDLVGNHAASSPPLSSRSRLEILSTIT